MTLLRVRNLNEYIMTESWIQPPQQELDADITWPMTVFLFSPSLHV